MSNAGGNGGTIEVEIRYLMQIAQELSIATTNLVNMQSDIEENGLDIKNLTTQFQIISGEMKRLAERTSTNNAPDRAKEREQLIRDVAILKHDSERASTRMNGIYIQVWGGIVVAIIVSVAGAAWVNTQPSRNQTQQIQR
jgi:hypothetical protein